MKMPHHDYTTKNLLEFHYEHQSLTQVPSPFQLHCVKVTFGCTRVALVRRQPQDNLGLLSL